MSTSVNIPRYLRHWEVKVRIGGSDLGSAVTGIPTNWLVLSSSDVGVDQQPLRVVFDIWQPSNYGAFWYGDITVYNLDGDTQQTLLTEGMEVVVKAGYDKPYGEIFRGRVMQPMWDRENVVDFRTTLHCVIGREVLSESMIIGNTKSFSTQDDIVRQMAAAAITPTVWQSNGQRAPIKWKVDLDPELKNKKLGRGKVMFGSPRKYLDQIARDNYMQWWYDSDDTVHIRDITKNPEAEPIVYTPQTGIIGTPQQTQEGVSLRVLLDPRLRVKYPAMRVKLDNTVIVQLKRTIGELPSILDKNNTYIVAGVRHVGDIRGVPWYTEITGVTSAYGKFNLLSGIADTIADPVDINH